MQHVWDYDVEELKKTESGRKLLLERKINYGVYLGDTEKIDLKEVKKYWNELDIEPKRRRLFKYLIWQT